MTTFIPYSWERRGVSARLEYDSDTGLYTPYLNVYGREFEGPKSGPLPMEPSRAVRKMCCDVAVELAELGNDALLTFWKPDDEERWERVRREVREMERKERERHERAMLKKEQGDARRRMREERMARERAECEKARARAERPKQPQRTASRAEQREHDEAARRTITLIRTVDDVDREIDRIVAEERGETVSPDEVRRARDEAYAKRL